MVTTLDTAPALDRATPWSRRLTVLVLVALAVLLAAELATRAIEAHLEAPLEWQSYETQTKVSQMDALGKHGGADIVFLGSSLMDTGLEPTIFDGQLGGHVVGYNAALSSSIPRMTEPWAQYVVVPKLHPKVIVLGLDSYDFTDEGPGRTAFLDAFLASPGARHAMGRSDVLQRFDRWLDGHSALWDHRFQLRDPETLADAVLGRRPVEDPEAAAVEPDGRQSFDQDLPFANRVVGGDLPVGDWSLGTLDPAAVDRLIRFARSRGIKVVLVDMPVTNDYVARHPHGEADYETFIAAVQALATRDGATVVDLDGLRDHSLFADEVHLNKHGAQVFSTQLAAALAPEHLIT